MSLQSARLPSCDRWKIGVAVDRLFAHMLAAGEQEYDESDSDQRADDDAQLSVPCPVFSHHHPPPMIPDFIGSAGVTDWLIKPFTGAYARTKVRAWVLRIACQWMRDSAQGEELRFAGRPLLSQRRRLTDAQPARGSRRPMPHRGTEARRSSENVISTEKAALLWMHCREVAPFETPSFRKRIGQLIAHATSTPEKRKPSSGCRWRITVERSRSSTCP
jgi:hypothetical protein